MRGRLLDTRIAALARNLLDHQKNENPKILPRIRLHDLRHRAASMAMQNGEPVVAVAARLGHQSAKMTLDVYGHLMPGAGRETADRLGAAKAKTPAEAGVFVW